MKIKLSDHFTFSRLLRYALPSVIMMIFTSIYSVVDGLFIANLVGSNALSSINIVMPMVIIVGAFGFMLGTGGSAVVAVKLGQGKPKTANEYFSMIISVIAAIGITLSAVCIIFIKPICRVLGASDILIDGCVTYGTILLIGSAAFMLQTTFQTFFVVAEKPHLGLTLTVISGVANMVLDYVFVYLLRGGIAGAAWATVCGYLIGSVVPLIYFLLPNKSLLRLSRFKFAPRVLLNSSINGSSEMMTQVSMSVITLLYNLQMMRLLGEDGVASITVIMYVNFILIAVFIGYSMGTAPIVGYNYGAGNREELKGVFRKSMIIISVCSVAMTASAIALSGFLSNIFIGANPELAQLTAHGFRLNAFSFLIAGFNIYGSSFFTALCNGKLSALISFLRSLILQAIMIIVLPMLLGLDGVWLSVVVAELLTVIVTVICFITNRKKYHYA